MKRKFIPFITSIILGLISLTSCGFLMLDQSDPYPPVPGQSEFIPADANYYRANRSTDTYYSLGQHSIYGQSVPKSLGTAKTIVIPVKIKGYENIATEAVKNRIEKAFFGTEEDTGWESVSTYFYKSSFNQYKIEGVVTDWYECGLTPDQIASKNNPTYDDGGTYHILEGAYNWLLSQNFNFDDYDLDNDGYIDSIWMVYGCPNYQNSTKITSDTFWAFSFVDYEYLDLYDRDVPVPNTYAWASYDFMNAAKSVGIEIDAHTYIHEHGHILGLEDYYDYDRKHDPLGKIDMQDFNVGDHNAYSKIAFGWATPYVVTGDCTITIGPAATTGHSILVRDPASPYNGNAFSEYLLLELMTPDGLWSQDATRAYPTLGNKTFTRAGVRMLHVDSRLLDHQNKFVEKTSNKSLYGLAYSNTPSQSYTSGSGGIYDDLLAFIPSDNSNNLLQKEVSVDTTVSYKDLFYTGDTFSIDEYTNFFRNGKLHDGTTIPYTITIDEVTSNSATISFKAK